MKNKSNFKTPSIEIINLDDMYCDTIQSSYGNANICGFYEDDDLMNE